MEHQVKGRRVLAPAIVCLGVILALASVASADQIPPLKVFSSITPASAADINYNFSLFRNWGNGGHVASDNMPGACMTTGCNFTGAVRHVGAGLTITNSSSSATTAGRLKILNAAAMLQLSSGAGGVASLVLESVEGAATWTIQKNAADMLVIDGPNDYTHYLQINDPITFATYGVPKFTENVPLVYTSPLAAGGAIDQVAFWRIPNDGYRTSDSSEYKVRAHIVCGAGGGNVMVDLLYQWVTSGDATAPLGISLPAVACGAAGVNRTTAWVTLSTGATSPLTANTFLTLVAANDGASGAAIGEIALEMQYKAKQLGNNVDN